jgi:hypothetical protein
LRWVDYLGGSNLILVYKCRESYTAEIIKIGQESVKNSIAEFEDGMRVPLAKK